MTSPNIEPPRLRAAVMDWAGTMVDFGCMAPPLAFCEIFRRRGVEITEAQAREPMGMAKLDHIRAISRMSDVADRWQSKHGSAIAESDVVAMYDEFLPLQKEIIGNHCALIPGVREAVARLREMGILFAGTTGYTRDLMDVITPKAAAEGYAPEVSLCADDVSQGRPAPWMIFEAMRRLNVYPVDHVIKVDDTLVGLLAGRNAGVWTVGVTRSGNGVGLTEAALNALPLEDQTRRIKAAADELALAMPHYMINSVAELPGIVEQINQRLHGGQRPL